MSLENKPTSEENSLDFTKPEDKVGDLLKNIETANRGIKLAESMNDEARVVDLVAKRKSFEDTLAVLTKTEDVKDEEITDPFANDRVAAKVEGQEKRSSSLV